MGRTGNNEKSRGPTRYRNEDDGHARTQILGVAEILRSRYATAVIGDDPPAGNWTLRKP